MRVAWILVLSCVVGMVSGCEGKRPEERPSGLKNMAPLPMSEVVTEGLDVEPNDNFLQAVNVSLTGDSMQWRGTLYSGDVDVWRIKAKAGTIANIRVIPEEDIDILAEYAVTDEEGAGRIYDMRGAGGEELLYQIRLTPQGGFLSVRARNEGRDGEQGYRIQVSRVLSREAGVVLESEPNDRRADAVSIGLGDTIRGAIYPTGDVDFYRLSLTQPSVVDFEMPDGAFELFVYQGEEVLWRGLSRQAATVRTEMLPANAKDLYVQIRGLEAVEHPAEYQFSVVPLARIPDEVEPNDTVETAQMIRNTAQNLEFSLSRADDIDIFRIMYAPDGFYRVRLLGVEPGVAKIELIDSAGQVRRDALADGLRVCDVPDSGDGSLLVRISSGGGTASYPVMYRLSAEALPKENFEQEPNSTVEMASRLPIGGTAVGHIFPADDVDMYRIEIPETGVPTGIAGKLGIHLESGYASRITLKLWDNAGYEISQISSKQISRPLDMAFDAPAGVYYLMVTGSGDGCAKPYVLQATFEPNSVLGEKPIETPSHKDATAESLPNNALDAKNDVKPAETAKAVPPTPDGKKGGVDADLAQILEAAANVDAPSEATGGVPLPDETGNALPTGNRLKEEDAKAPGALKSPEIFDEDSF